MTHANRNFVDGLPNLSSFDPKTRNLVVIDDLMSETDERVTKRFTKKCHHCNTYVVGLVQHLFPKGKESRTISINAQYMMVFMDPRDSKQVVNLAKQMYPGGVKYMQEAFRDVTSTRVLVLRSETGHSRTLALRTNRCSTPIFRRYKMETRHGTHHSTCRHE